MRPVWKYENLFMSWGSNSTMSSKKKPPIITRETVRGAVSSAARAVRDEPED